MPSYSFHGSEMQTMRAWWWKDGDTRSSIPLQESSPPIRRQHKPAFSPFTCRHKHLTRRSSLDCSNKTTKALIIKEEEREEKLSRGPHKNVCVLNCYFGKNDDDDDDDDDPLKAPTTEKRSQTKKLETFYACTKKKKRKATSQKRVFAYVCVYVCACVCVCMRRVKFAITCVYINYVSHMISLIAYSIKASEAVTETAKAAKPSPTPTVFCVGL